jgi:hypothetical protein
MLVSWCTVIVAFAFPMPQNYNPSRQGVATKNSYPGKYCKSSGKTRWWLILKVEDFGNRHIQSNGQLCDRVGLYIHPNGADPVNLSFVHLAGIGHLLER